MPRTSRAVVLGTYTALFGELASHAVDRGIIDHLVHVPIGDPTIEAAWMALGFGRVNLVAIRDLASIALEAALGSACRDR
jgi:hypothetical protein